MTNLKGMLGLLALFAFHLAAAADSTTFRCEDNDAGSIDDALEANARAFAPGKAPRIFAALGKDRYPQLRQVLAAGDDPNICHSGMTPLMLAAVTDDQVGIRLLLDGGAYVDAPQDARGGTALHIALSLGRLASARLLIDRGADVLSADDSGLTPLHQLVATRATADGRRTQIALAGELLRRGAVADAVGVRGVTPLMFAALGDSPGLVALLLRHGANPAARNDKGDSALDMARRRGNAAIVKTLEQAAGASRATPR